eukprot:12610743-Prorocentrum_lima.AAC.1
MTSSLVGSEMCIRDSPRSTWLSFTVPTATRFNAEIREHREFINTTIRRAVSYTHLTLPTICSV